MTTLPDAAVVLRADHLCKRFGDLTAVDGISLEVRRGEILGFLGPNGAGKTTSLKMMCGLLRPDAGGVTLNGESVVAGRARGLKAIGVSPQNLVVWETLTCLEQLELAARLYDQPRRAARARAEHLLEVFGLTDKAHRLGKTLSGGMQRRLNIALGLVHDPQVLFLDEPQAGLDPQSRVLVRDYIQSQRGTMTIVITTHDMEEVEKLADRVCIIDRGKLLVLDTVSRLKSRLGTEHVIEVSFEAGAVPSPLPGLLRLAPPGTLGLDGDRLLLPAANAQDLLAKVLPEATRLGLRLATLRSREATLEDVFIALTGRRLRE